MQGKMLYVGVLNGYIMDVFDTSFMARFCFNESRRWNASIWKTCRKNKLIGNGSEGVLEGHASRIYYDGTEQYRYWLRNDVQGEVSFY